MSAYPQDFETWYEASAAERKRQAYLRWLANRATPKDVAKAQALDKARRNSE